jgi:hypothetical protein
MIERKESFKGDGKHLTEERNLGEAEIIAGDRYVQKYQQEIYTIPASTSEGAGRGQTRAKTSKRAAALLWKRTAAP